MPRTYIKCSLCHWKRLRHFASYNISKAWLWICQWLKMSVFRRAIATSTIFADLAVLITIQSSETPPQTLQPWFVGRMEQYYFLPSQNPGRSTWASYGPSPQGEESQYRIWIWVFSKSGTESGKSLVNPARYGDSVPQYPFPDRVEAVEREMNCVDFIKCFGHPAKSGWK